MSPRHASRRSILFLTSCPEVWGGSEELWSGAAVELQCRGHRVLCGRTEQAKRWKSHPRWKRLAESGVKVGAFGVPTLLRAVPDAVLRYAEPFAPLVYGLRNRALAWRLRQLAPDLVVLAQGNTFDGMYSVEMPLIVHYTGKPFVLVCQKNAETDWPDDFMRARSINHFRRARRVYFVSEHNRDIAEHQLGFRLENAEVVHNPYLVATREPLPWPENSDGRVHFACVGRLYPREKGQDLLINVLSLPKWRERPVCVNFYGTGANAEGLEGMARLLRLDNVRFHGFTTDVTRVWRENHALVLPSRAEGLALAQVEAMVCGRVPIVTAAGGAGEILEDGVTGFLARSASEESLDDAMERAWARRHEWREIGCRASESVLRTFPSDPCAVFADKLESLL
jgi:glycosyltransferase involved in cell wall biosynthesis